MKKLPIGLQVFKEYIEQDYLYVDKTEWVWKLVSQGKYYFFARPRRFGKSLLISTLKSYFEGREDLFRGLYIHQKEQKWIKYPIIRINFASISYRSGKEDFRNSILFTLNYIAKDYGLELVKNSVTNSFSDLVKQLFTKFGPVVILVDEYDKALVDKLEDGKGYEENRAILNELYGNLKGLDEYIRFVFLTGVSRFAKVGIFSGLNNLQDISMDNKFSSMVGFTQNEVEQYFAPYLPAIQEEYQLPLADVLSTLKEWYNGYSWDSKTTHYNPFSIINFFQQKVIRNYWFATGTPTFLINLIKKQKALPENFDNLVVNDLIGSSIKFRALPLYPILFQTGYLTITKIIPQGMMGQVYELNYPNREVKQAFHTALLSGFTHRDEFLVQAGYLHLRTALETENAIDFIKQLKGLFANIPSRLHTNREAYYQSSIYLILSLIGVKMFLEKATNKGIIDGVIEYDDKVYIFEFKYAANKRIKKVTTLVNKALQQIKDRKYYEAYLGKHKKIILFGIGFLDRQIDGRMEVLD
ncbi:MAG: AAA family ATPase [Saprospiraceae bacterium]